MVCHALALADWRRVTDSQVGLQADFREIANRALTFTIGLGKGAALQHVAWLLADDEAAYFEDYRRPLPRARLLRRIWRLVGQNFIVRLVPALIILRLDYRIIYVPRPATIPITKLMRVQNLAATLTLRFDPRDRGFPALI